MADEDHSIVRRVPLPVRADRPAIAVALPGRPAQVLALADRVLVTIRSPGLLLIMRPDKEVGLVETARVSLPSDAWGVAVTPDEKTALVSSAWTHVVSAVDLDKASKRWSVDVAREPRGIVIRQDGVAYVTHLVGAALTRIDGLDGEPRVSRVALPASPLRAPSGKALAASLGYAAALSDDGKRLFVARHALGAMGRTSWYGAATLDVLLTKDDAPLAPLHVGNAPIKKSDLAAQMLTSGADANLPMTPLFPFAQPRAVVFRKSTRTVLVASEGDDRVVELDALAVDPTLAVTRTYKVGSDYDPTLPVASTCGAPTGLALSADEATAWVFCRATYDLATITLDPYREGASFTAEKPAITRLADDRLEADAALGRRIFYNATDPITSGGAACAACHPDGRDDGFVWREVTFVTAEGPNTNFVGSVENIPDEAHRKGFARRTPMLAGRVGSHGPYGWHAESETLVARLNAGYGLHRWGAIPTHSDANLSARSLRLVPFLRHGLVAPPRDTEPELTAAEERGQSIFASEQAGCVKCHARETEYTDRMAYPMVKWAQNAAYDDESKERFKTPSLKFVAERAPYFHDGSAASLDALIANNADRMGKTSHLSQDERADLLAFLRTL